MRNTFMIILLIATASAPISCTTQLQIRTLHKEHPSIGVMMQEEQLARMEKPVVRDTVREESDVMNAILDENGEMKPIDVLDAAFVVARHKQVSERHGTVELDFEIVVPEIMLNTAWQVRITPVLTILNDKEQLDSILISGKDYKRRQQNGYEKYEKYLKSLLPLNEEELFLYRRSLKLFLERYAAAPFGVTEEEAVKHYTKNWLKRLNLIRHSRVGKKYERFVKSPYINGGVRIDTIIDKSGGNIHYRYRQLINTTPKMRRIDMNLRSSIETDGSILYSNLSKDTTKFYISSISSLADNREKYIVKITSRDSVITARADIRFELDKYYFKEEIADNKKEFGKAESILNSLLENKDLVLDSIIIKGGASPEGRQDYNKRLSQERAGFVLKKVKETVKKHRDGRERIYFASIEDLSSIIDTTGNMSSMHPAAPIDYDNIYKNIRAYGIGEDWAGFEKHLMLSGCFSESQVSEILRCVSDTDESAKEERLRELPYYKTISDSIYDKMRNVEFSFHIHKKDAISDTVVTTQIDTLYMKGVGYLKDRDYKKALEYLNGYKDYNTALAYLLMDYNYSALGILENLEASGDRDYLMAIAYSRLGDTEKAVRFLKSAIEQDNKFKYRYRLDPECAKLI